MSLLCKPVPFTRQIIYTNNWTGIMIQISTKRLVLLACVSTCAVYIVFIKFPHKVPSTDWIPESDKLGPNGKPGKLLSTQKNPKNADDRQDGVFTRNLTCNCNEKCSHAIDHSKTILGPPCENKSTFKIPGVVFDCISRKHFKTYNVNDLDKISRPVTLETDQQGEDPAARKSSFVQIFNKQIWGGKETGEKDRMNQNFQASGPGSSLINTQGCVALLHSVIEKLKVTLNKDIISIADIPCGDLQWVSHFLKTRTDINYTGIDIVPDLIRRHTMTYRNHKNINFINTDVVQSPLNQSFDIIFSRQMMQHIKNMDIQRVLYHFSTSGSRYMIATTYSDVSSNTELPSTTGYRYRLVNLELHPFNLVPPTCTYRETQQTDNYLGMWELPLKVKH